MAKPKLERVTSPKGIAKYPRLSKPDTKFVPEGEFSCKLILDVEKDAEFLSKLEARAKEKFAEVKAELKEKKKVKAMKELTLAVPYEEILDDDGDATGKVEVKAKLKHVVKLKDDESFTQTVDIFDSKGKPMSKDVVVGGGSTLRMACDIVPYYNPSAKDAGISLRLKGVKVIDLVEYTGGASAEAYGFGDEEDGYDASDDVREDDDFSDDDEEGDENDDF